MEEKLNKNTDKNFFMSYLENYKMVHKSITEIREFSHHGEILQGVFEGNDGILHRGLVSLPCNYYTSQAIFIKNNNNDRLDVFPNYKTKSLQAAKNALAYLNLDKKYGGYLIVNSDIPLKWGLGSSTSDVVASINAVAKSFDLTLSSEQIAKLSVESEIASDSIMFENSVLFAQREAFVIENFNKKIPPIEVLGFNTDNEGNGIDTLLLAPIEYSLEDIETFKVLRALIRRGIYDQDVSLIGKVSSASAHINQKYLPKYKFDQIEKIANRTNAIGIQVAHSGTICGIMYDYNENEKTRIEKIQMAKSLLNEIEIKETWKFNNMYWEEKKLCI